MFGFQQLFTDPCPELTKEHLQAMKGFECADNEIDLKAGVGSVPEWQDFDVMVHLSFSAEKPPAILDKIVCLRSESLELSLEFS